MLPYLGIVWVCLAGQTNTSEYCVSSPVGQDSACLPRQRSEKSEEISAAGVSHVRDWHLSVSAVTLGIARLDIDGRAVPLLCQGVSFFPALDEQRDIVESRDTTGPNIRCSWPFGLADASRRLLISPRRSLCSEVLPNFMYCTSYRACFAAVDQQQFRVYIKPLTQGMGGGGRWSILWMTHLHLIFQG